MCFVLSHFRLHHYLKKTAKLNLAFSKSLSGGTVSQDSQGHCALMFAAFVNY